MTLAKVFRQLLGFGTMVIFHTSQRIWNRYTEKMPIDLFESKWDRNIPRSNFRATQNLVSEHFHKRFQLPIHCLYKRFQILRVWMEDLIIAVINKINKICKCQ